MKFTVIAKNIVFIIIGLVIAYLLLNRCSKVRDHFELDYIDTVYTDTNTISYDKNDLDILEVKDSIIAEKIKWKYKKLPPDTITEDSIIYRYIDTAHALQDYMTYKTYSLAKDTNDMSFNIKIGIYANDLDEFTYNLRNNRETVIKKYDTPSNELILGVGALFNHSHSSYPGGEINLLFKNKKDIYFGIGAGYINDNAFSKVSIHKKL